MNTLWPFLFRLLGMAAKFCAGGGLKAVAWWVNDIAGSIRNITGATRDIQTSKKEKKSHGSPNLICELTPEERARFNRDYRILRVIDEAETMERIKVIEKRILPLVLAIAFVGSLTLARPGSAMVTTSPLPTLQVWALTGVSWCVLAFLCIPNRIRSMTQSDRHIMTQLTTS